MISVGELLAAACQRFTDRPALVHGKDMRTYGEPAERGASFCLALARQGARVVVNNRNRVVDAGRGPANDVGAAGDAAGGEAVVEYSDAADPGAGQAMGRGGRAALGTAGYLRGQRGHRGGGHVPPAARRAVQRGPGDQPAGQHPAGPGRDGGDAAAGYGRIILVASTGGLHGDVGLSAYAASKGGLLAESGRGEPKEFRVSVEAFNDLMDGEELR